MILNPAFKQLIEAQSDLMELCLTQYIWVMVKQTLSNPVRLSYSETVLRRLPFCWCSAELFPLRWPYLAQPIIPATVQDLGALVSKPHCVHVIIMSFNLKNERNQQNKNEGNTSSKQMSAVMRVTYYFVRLKLCQQQQAVKICWTVCTCQNLSNNFFDQ